MFDFGCSQEMKSADVGDHSDACSDDEAQSCTASVVITEGANRQPHHATHCRAGHDDTSQACQYVERGERRHLDLQHEDGDDRRHDFR